MEFSVQMDFTLVIILRFISTYTDGDVRLVGGKEGSDGRLEVYYKGQWGTVCMNGFHMKNVKTVCMILQYYKNDR